LFYYIGEDFARKGMPKINLLSMMFFKVSTTLLPHNFKIIP